MSIREYFINKLAIWLEPVFDRINDNKNTKSVNTVNEAFRAGDESDRKKIKAYDDYVNTRNKRKLDEAVSNMMKWEVTRRELQNQKQPKANKVHRSTSSGSGDLDD